MAPQVTIFFHKIESTMNACTKRVGFRKSFFVSESPIKCNVPKLVQKAKPQATPKVVKTQLRRTPSKNAIRNARKRAARALRKKEAKKQSIETILSELSWTSPIVAEGKNISGASNVSIPKKIANTCFAQIMIGSIPISLYPTDLVLTTSSSETSEESQDDDSEENIEAQVVKPQPNPRALVVEATSQDVYPGSSTGKSKAIIMEKKVVNIPHPQRKLLQRAKTIGTVRNQILISGGRPKTS